MKGPETWLLSCLVLLGGACHETNSFSLLTRMASTPNQMRGQASRITSRTAATRTTEEMNQNRPTDDNDPSSQAQTTIQALQRILVRQQEDLEETQRLLKIYTSTDATEINEDPKTLSLMESFMSGFDYGFVSRSEGAIMESSKNNPKMEIEGASQEYGPPGSVWAVGIDQFMRNLNAMQDEYKDEEDVELTPMQEKYQAKLEQLTLNTSAIWEREKNCETLNAAPLIIKLPYLVLCFFLDVVFEGRYVPSRFFMLETVARMPYFSYISMLHLYETLGFWRRSSDVKRIHFAEELNEFNHLLIMESLGGDQRWWVRFLAQHSAIAYYIGLCLLWMAAPSLSYKFSEMLETHAVNTYSQLLDENEQLLKELPPPTTAIQYYVLGVSDPFYAEFQTNKAMIRKPGAKMDSLYRVFSAIRDDEGDHVDAMEKCLDPEIVKVSPSLERKVLLTATATAAVSYLVAATGGSDLVGIEGSVEASSALDGAIAGAIGGAIGMIKEAVETVDAADETEVVAAAATADETFIGLISVLSAAFRWLTRL